MRASRSPGALGILVALIPIALVLGIFLGGHPNTLPGFARDALVNDSDGRLYEEAMDTIERDYYRKIDRKQLLNTSLCAAVESLQDQFSHYFSPKDYAAFELDTEGQFEGVGMSVHRGQGRAARRGGLRRLAGQVGRAEGGQHHRLRQRQAAGRQDVRPGHDADQGPGGLAGHARAQGRRASSR